MASLPGQPTNPRYLITDTDAFLQLLLTEQVAILKLLKQEYSIQPAIVEAVEAELRLKTAREFSAVRSRFDKALSSGVVAVINESFLVEREGVTGVGLLGRINDLGRRFYKFVDRGEAYSHAAAVTLAAPILSHDILAIRKLIAEGLSLSRPKLRAFDVMCFGFQIGVLKESDCDNARSKLLQEREFIVECFSHRSFSSGLPLFYLRLADKDHPVVGASSPQQVHDERLWIGRVHDPLSIGGLTGAGRS